MGRPRLRAAARSAQLSGRHRVAQLRRAAQVAALLGGWTGDGRFTEGEVVHPEIDGDVAAVGSEADAQVVPGSGVPGEAFGVLAGELSVLERDAIELGDEGVVLARAG